MGKYFSPSKNGFFDEIIHGKKGAKGSKIPNDALAISNEQHADLLAEQAGGKRIIAGKGGAPVALTPEPTPEELVEALRARRDRALAATDWTQLGDAGLDEIKRQLWADHRQALRDFPALVEAAIAAGKDAAKVKFPEPPA